MKIDGALTHATSGIQRGLAGARQHAGEIASADQLRATGPDSLAWPLVGLIQDRLQVSASAAVLKAADDMIGSLFDAKA
jgi:hypothetical protein